MSAPESAYVIVGGGLAGLFAARVLRTAGINAPIYIIEKSNEVGGLMAHETFANPIGDGKNYDFDYGAHYVLATGEAAIDQILHKDMDLNQYHEFQGSLLEGQYLNGNLYLNSGCANVSLLNTETQKQIYKDLQGIIENNEEHDDPENVFDACIQRYGEKATEAIFVPAFEKFTGHHPSKLDPSMETTFAPSRLIVADREKSIELKKDPAWDNLIAYADCTDGKSDIVKYYPKKGGVGLWLDTMKKNLEQEGVQILTECTVTEITAEQGVIRRVRLSDNQIIPCKQLIWTLPAIFLALTTKTEVPSAKPDIRSVSVVHYLTDQRPVERAYWITNYDPDSPLFRVTIYDNFAPTDEEDNTYRLSVEILRDGSFQASDADINLVFEELKKMTVIPQNANMLWSNVITKTNGFPILKPHLKQIYAQQIDILEQSFKNVSIVGNRPGVTHGQIGIMQNVYNSLTSLSRDKQEKTVIENNQRQAS